MQKVAAQQGATLELTAPAASGLVQGAGHHGTQHPWPHRQRSASCDQPQVIKASASSFAVQHRAPVAPAQGHEAALLALACL